MKGRVDPIIWGTIDNRDYLRALYYLAIGFYAAKNYKKAKQWFLFLIRCSPMEIGIEKIFLQDLRQPEPEGNIHTVMMQGMFSNNLTRHKKAAYRAFFSFQLNLTCSKSATFSCVVPDTALRNKSTSELATE